MTTLIVIRCDLSSLDVDNTCHLNLWIAAADQSGMRSRRSIPTVSVSPANNDITIRINDIRHIDIGVLISNVISIDHIINVFCGRVLIIMSVVVNAIRDISCMHI